MILVVNVCKEKLHYYEFAKPIEDILKCDFFTKSYFEISDEDLVKADKVIICGTSLKDFDYFNNLEKFGWIKNFDKPILGICAGCQIINSVFGGSVSDIGNKVKDYKSGDFSLRLDSRMEIGFVGANFKKSFLDYEGKLEVYGLHKLGLNISKEFENFAQNDKGVQAIKHKDKEIYGTLFHPEVRNKEMILNFVEL